jgi:hypothetical protein
MEGTVKTTLRAARDAQQSILLDFLARGCRALEAIECEGQARRMLADSWVFPEMFRKAKSISSAPWRAPEPRGDPHDGSKARIGTHWTNVGFRHSTRFGTDGLIGVSCQMGGCSFQDERTWSVSNRHKHREGIAVKYFAGLDVLLEETSI